MDLPKLVRKAEQAIRENRLAEAQTLYEEVLAGQPDNMPGLFNLALLHEKRAHFVAAATLYQRLAALPADKVHPRWRHLAESVDKRAKIFYWAGLAMMERLDFAGALAFFRPVLANSPENVYALYHAGLCCLKTGDAAAAAGHFAEVTARVPVNGDAWFNLGNAQQLAGRREEAKDSYRRALALEPDFAEAYYNLGQALRREDGTAARECLDKALRLKPSLQLPGGEVNGRSPHLKGRFWKDCRPPADFKAVPIFLNCRDRLTPLRQLVGWLRTAGYRNIILLDNNSTYPPLLAYYQSLAGDKDVRVIFLKKNLGHTALWTSNVLKTLSVDTPFVYSDADIVPLAECPENVVEVFYRILITNPYVKKVGFGLKIDDIPACYGRRDEIIDHERQFWLHPLDGAAPPQYVAPVDTTFALYRHGNYYEIGNDAIRTGYPYLARHTDWYLDTANLGEEELYYFSHADGKVSSTKRSLRL